VKFRAIASRRLVLMFSILAMPGGAWASPQAPVVKTVEGPVRGKLINSDKVRAFQGIPYAAPPVGRLRWQAPQPVTSWSAEFDATHYGHHCAQNHVFDDMVFQDSTGSNDPGSEDCLTLNVYTPAHATAKSGLPVMFWIHGGGYVGGASSEPRHNGDFLPLKGVVLITINYRLGVFGFLALPELANEQGGSSGNYGLMDMVAALQWVKRNVAAFGGDPGRVTIFGESAGSFAVSTLMAAPSARGLFHRAIGESGGALNLGTFETLQSAGNRDAAWAGETGAKNLAGLRALSTAKLLAAAGKKDSVHFSPVIDGKFLSESVLDTYNAGKQAKVPLLAGFNRDEGSFFATGMTAEKWQGTAKLRYGDKADAFLRLYPGSSDAEALRSASDFGGDQFIAYGTWKWLEVDRRTGSPNIYRYKMDLAAPPSKFHQGWYAFHSDDIEYVFGTLDTRPGAAWRPEDYALSDQMMSYWTNFARSGDPNGLDGRHHALPLWPKYGPGDPLLHLDHPTKSQPDENRPRYAFWLEKEKAGDLKDD
jgi:para-nitrobenzyl esterase